MKITMQAFKGLSYEEMQFVYCMLRKHGGLPNPKQNGRGRKNGHQRPSNKPRPDNVPDLNNLECESWNDCTDEHFLAYRAIMEKTIIND